MNPLGSAIRAIESRFRPTRDEYARAGLFGFSGAGVDTFAGRKVGADNALAEHTFYTCVKILCEDLSSLPFLMYQVTGPREKERALDHPLYWMLKQQPNPEMTAQDLVDFQVGSLLMRGNSVTVIERDAAGRRIALWPLRWDYIELERDPETRELVFVYHPNRMEPMRFMRRDVWFARGPISLDGIRGLSVIEAQRETIGEALAQQEYNARFYSNGAAPRGVLQTPNTLSTPAYERIQSSWMQQQGGLSNAQKAAILEEGLEWKPMGMSPEDAQVLGQKRYSRSAVAGLFRIPAPMVNDQERSTMNNTEELIRAYVKFAVMPWAERLEQTGKRDLLMPMEKRGYEFEMMMDQLLRGDFETRTQGYWRGRMGGWLTVNEIRGMDNLPPMEGGDALLSPLNMGAVGKSAGEPGDGGQGNPGQQ